MPRSFMRASCALAALALLTAPGAARAGFTPPEAVAADGDLVDVAVGADGTVAALWRTGDDLVAGVRPLGGTFAPETLDVDATTGGAIAVAPDGEVAAVYVDDDANVVQRTRPAGATEFDAVGAVATGAAPTPAELAVRADGSFVAAWRDGAEVRAAIAEGGTWPAAPEVVEAAEGPGAEPPVLSAGPADRLALAWPGGSDLRVAVVPADGDVFGAAATVDTPAALASPAAAFRSSGQLDVTWSDGLDVRRATRGPAAADVFAAATTVETLASTPLGPGAAPGLAAWSGGGQMRIARNDAAADALPGATDAESVPLATALRSERTLVAWRRAAGLEFRVVDGSGGAASGGLAPEGVATTAAQLAGDPASPVSAVAWTAGGAPRVALFDDVPPQLGGLTIPATGTAGTPVELAVTASDGETGPPAIVWDLGDGRSAEGATPAVTFPAPGPRTITVTVSDAGGNTAMASGTIDVAAALAQTQTQTPRGGGVFGFDVLRDIRAPTLGGLRLSHTTFRIDGGQTAMVAQRRARPTDRGTQVTWTLDEPATVYLGVEKLVNGWRSGRGAACAAKRRTRSAKRCTRVVVMGQLTRRGKTGRNGMRFTGRFGRQALSPGKYRFAVFARDVARNTSAVQRQSFTMRP